MQIDDKMFEPLDAYEKELMDALENGSVESVTFDNDDIKKRATETLKCMKQKKGYRMTTIHIDIHDDYKETFFDFINALPKDAVVVTHSSDEESSQKNTVSVDNEIASKEEARISGVSYVSEQDYSADKDDFFNALHGK